MNKIIIFVSIFVAVILLNMGLSSKVRTNELNNENLQLQCSIQEMRQVINERESLPKMKPLPLETAYNTFLNRMKLLESYSGTNMHIQLEGAMGAPDVSTYYENTEYRGVRGVKIRVVVDKFLQETDMGTVLDDIHLLENSTDFLVSEISKDNNNLIVKGEIYGI